MSDLTTHNNINPGVVVSQEPLNPASTMIEKVTELILSGDVDADKMDRLLDVQERMMSKNAEMMFNSAVSSAQGKMPRIIKRKDVKGKNGQVQYKYAPLEDIMEMLQPVMDEHDLSLRHTTKTTDGGCMLVKTLLMHKFGHSEPTELLLPIDTSGSKNNVQGVGSTLSFGKRYNICSHFNIVFADEDDDAQMVDKKINKTQLSIITTKLSNLEDPEYVSSKIFKMYKIDSFNQLPITGYDFALATLTKAIREQEKKIAEGLNDA